MQQLIYLIAEHYIVLHTPDAQATEQLIHRNYSPFAVSNIEGDAIPILEVFSSSTIAEDPEQQLAEENKDGLAAFELFRRAGGDLYLTMQTQGKKRSCLISADNSKLYLGFEMTQASEQVFFERMIMIAYRMVITRHRMFQIHSSTTMVGDRALLFLGVSGTGKSTHSRLFRTYVTGAELLNDDEPIVRLCPDGQVRVYGCPWSGSTPCYRNASAEVVAFVHLRQSPENHIQQLRGRDALNTLFISIPMLYSAGDLQRRSFELIADALAVKPVYLLDCRPDEGAVRLTKALLD